MTFSCFFVSWNMLETNMLEKSTENTKSNVFITWGVYLNVTFVT